MRQRKCSSSGTDYEATERIQKLVKNLQRRRSRVAETKKLWDINGERPNRSQTSSGRRSVRIQSAETRTNGRIIPHILKMKFIFVALLVLQTELKIASAGKKEHVHLKIYVPELIKHHVHTRTILIHVHEPAKKAPPKKNDYAESHHDDWSMWSSYSNYDNHGNSHENGGSAAGAYRDNQDGRYANQADDHSYATPYERPVASSGPPSSPPADSAYPSYYRDNANPPLPHYDYRANNYRNVDDQHTGSQPAPPKSVFSNGVRGYSHPPQYEIYENVVEDLPPSAPESYKSSHEEGHSERHHSETGHLYANELNNFYDEKREESDESAAAASEEVEESNGDHDSYRYVGDNYVTTRRMTR